MDEITGITLANCAELIVATVKQVLTVKGVTTLGGDQYTDADMMADAVAAINGELKPYLTAKE